MQSILNTQPLLQLDYIATDRTPETLSANETELHDAGISISQWDPSSLPSGNLTNADLAVCNCSTSVLGNAAEIISNLAAAVKEGGFVLLHTLLKEETLGEIVSFLTSPDLQQKQSFLSQVNNLEAQMFSQWLDRSLLLVCFIVINIKILLHVEVLCRNKYKRNTFKYCVGYYCILYGYYCFLVVCLFVRLVS